MTAHLFTWLTGYFKAIVETSYSGEKTPFKILLLVDNAPGHLSSDGAGQQDCCCFQACYHNICSAAHGSRSNFKSYYLRNTFCKTVAALKSDSSDGSRQSKLKTFWKGFSILDAIKIIHDSWEEVQISTYIGVSKKLILTLRDDFEGFKVSVEEVTGDVVEIARELEMEPKYMTELLHCHDKTLTDDELLLMNEPKKWFLEMESPAGEGAVKIVEMTTRDLEYNINLVNKAAAEFERTDSNFERSSPGGKMLSNSIACYREISQKRESQLKLQASLLFYFKELPQPPQPSAAISIEARPSTSKKITTC
ncbi:collectrin isoform X1 [Camelus dromedarius]|uniref:collectrin isoform X1 n=1 Tax=Camelus dromedarius TaxID=9838 RepID=UPI00126339E7|nr:collectrin isoform X1 [Camelus dromedarius]